MVSIRNICILNNWKGNSEPRFRSPKAKVSGPIVFKDRGSSVIKCQGLYLSVYQTHFLAGNLGKVIWHFFESRHTIGLAALLKWWPDLSVSVQIYESLVLLLLVNSPQPWRRLETLYSHRGARSRIASKGSIDFRYENQNIFHESSYELLVTKPKLYAATLIISP